MSFTTPGKAIFVTVSGAPLVNRQISVITYEFYYEPIQHAGCNAVKTSLWNRRVRTCGIDGPGLHFKTPWIDQRFIVDQGEHSLRLPHSEVDRRGTFQNTSKDIDEQEDKLILTGDLYAAV